MNLFEDTWMTPPLTISEKEKLIIVLKSIGLIISENTEKNLFNGHEEFPRICRTVHHNADYHICACRTDMSMDPSPRIEMKVEEIIEYIKKHHNEEVTNNQFASNRMQQTS